MKYTFTPEGVCSQQMTVELDGQNTIQELSTVGGCSGNLQGIARLVKGMSAEEAIARLRGIHCGMKDTSCPDQLAVGLEEILQKQQAEKKDA